MSGTNSVIRFRFRFRARLLWLRKKNFDWWVKGFTSFYVSGFFILFGFRAGEVFALPLNELGDFLAGGFGPIAFLWLILGYKQQGEELKASSAALEAQVTELKNNLELQRINAEKQDLSVDPIFYIQYLDEQNQFGKSLDRLVITNKGDTCRQVHFTFVSQKRPKKIS
jgi:hypothetical protein